MTSFWIDQSVILKNKLFIIRKEESQIDQSVILEKKLSIIKKKNRKELVEYREKEPSTNKNDWSKYSNEVEELAKNAIISIDYKYQNIIEREIIEKIHDSELQIAL